MQDFIAILIAIAAAAFLIYRGWRRLVQRRSAACGACSNCPANHAAESAQLVQLAPPTRDIR